VRGAARKGGPYRDSTEFVIIVCISRSSRWLAVHREVLMAGIITIAPGHDASYPWRQIGTAAGVLPPRQPGAAYYLSPAEKGGEPPGHWHGDGIAELGFRDGQIIEREVFERLYGKFLDPRDPLGQARLGRAPQRFRSVEAIHAALIALEPEATAERRDELMIEAKLQARVPVLYFDATFSVSKSITLLHASAMANAASAASSADLEAVAYWEEAAAAVWACIEAGNRAALAYLQREAGYTRSGYHGRDVAGSRVGGGRMRTDSSSGPSPSTPAATATRSYTFTTWSSTVSCGTATASGGRWTPGRCMSTAAERRRSPHW
jgi:TrwC relaxase